MGGVPAGPDKNEGHEKKKKKESMRKKNTQKIIWRLVAPPEQAQMEN